MSELMDRIKKLQEEQERMCAIESGSGRDILKMLMDKEGKRPGTVAVKSGVSRQALGVMLKKNKSDVPASMLAKLLDVLGYDLLIVKRGDSDLDSAIKIK